MFFLLLQNYFYALTDVRALKELIQRSGRKLKAVVAIICLLYNEFKMVRVASNQIAGVDARLHLNLYKLTEPSYKKLNE